LVQPADEILYDGLPGTSLEPLNMRPAWPPDQSQDAENPDYIEGMFKFFNDFKANIEYECLFNGTSAHTLHPQEAALAISSQRYKALWRTAGLLRVGSMEQTWRWRVCPGQDGGELWSPSCVSPNRLEGAAWGRSLPFGGGAEAA
jgi:hypothetical protein